MPKGRNRYLKDEGEFYNSRTSPKSNMLENMMIQKSASSKLNLKKGLDTKGIDIFPDQSSYY